MLLHGVVSSVGLRRFAVLAVLAVVPATLSCHRVPLVAPSGSSLTLLATTNVLAVNGSTDIIAVIIEGGLAAGTATTAGSVVAGVGTPVHDGTLVTFTTTLGHLEPGESTTRNGRAAVRLVGDGRSGTATITAFSGGATNTLDVDIGAAAATRVAVTANPQSLPSTGGSTTISARVEDQQGNGLAGVPVSFSTTKGSLSSTTVVTSDQGIALTTLSTTAEATVTASTGGSAAALTGTVLVTLKPATTVSLTPPTSAQLGVPATLTVTPGTNTVIADVFLDFGDGTSFSLGQITSATQVSHIFRQKGEVTVTARAVDSTGAITTVSTRVAVSPLAVTGSASPTATTTTPKVGDPVTFTVTPTNASASIERTVWDFGDGTTQSSQSTQITHAYGSTGAKVVSVAVYPFGSDDATSVIIVVDIKP